MLEAMRHKWKQKLQLPLSHPWGVVRQSTAKPCLRRLKISGACYPIISWQPPPQGPLSAIREHFDGVWKKIFLEVGEEVV